MTDTCRFEAVTTAMVRMDEISRKTNFRFFTKYRSLAAFIILYECETKFLQSFQTNCLLGISTRKAKPDFVRTVIACNVLWWVDGEVNRKIKDGKRERSGQDLQRRTCSPSIKTGQKKLHLSSCYSLQPALAGQHSHSLVSVSQIMYTRIYVCILS